MSRLAFTDRWHQYTLDGKRVPSVSSIVSAAIAKPGMTYAAAKEAAIWAELNRESFDLLGGDEWRKAAAGAHRAVWNQKADDGRVLHKLAETLIYGDPMPAELNGEPVAEHVQDMAEQLARFFDVWQVEPVAHEAMIFNERYKYAGRFDIVAQLRDGRRWLLDYKTGESGIWPESSLQLTGYRNATHFVREADNVDCPMDDLGIEDTACVWLRPDNWELVPVRTDPQTFGYFLHCGAIAQWAKWRREESVFDPLPRPELVE